MQLELASQLIKVYHKMYALHIDTYLNCAEVKLKTPSSSLQDPLESQVPTTTR